MHYLPGAIHFINARTISSAMSSYPILPRREITPSMPYKICFVCLGNICRSPTAEGILQHLVNESGLQDYFFIDSAGTAAYHIGEPANSKSQEVANKHGIRLFSRGRRFGKHDLEEFDLILAMDRQNLADILEMDRQAIYRHKVFLIRAFGPAEEGREKDVPDPYYGGMEGFERVFRIIEQSCMHLLQQLQGMRESR